MAGEYSFTGVDRRGVARGGRLDFPALSSLRDFTERRHRNGWQSLTVYADPQHRALVAAVEVRDGERIWWAEG